MSFSTLCYAIIILALILFNGVLATSEIAILSSRKTRLEEWANSGNESAKTALLLSNRPSMFLPTIQIGMTVTAIVAGVFGGATIGDSLADCLRQVDGLEPYASALGFGSIVIVISYLTLILGELAPKRVALAHPERMACIVAPPMYWLSRVGAPVVQLLNASSGLVVKLLGVVESNAEPVSTEEIKLLIEHGTEAGVFQEAEEEMVNSVLRLGSRRITELMTPRPKLVALDIGASEQEILSVALSPPTRLLVIDGNMDKVIGYVFTRHILAQISRHVVDIQACLKQPLFVPETKSALQVLGMFRQSGTHIAMVLDEYGGVQGVVTMTDMLKAIVGELDLTEDPINAIVKSADCCWLLEGYLPIDQLKDLIGLESLPLDESRSYHTLAGFVMHRLGHVPQVAEQFEWNGISFRVTMMSGSRIQKVGIMLLSQGQASSSMKLPAKQIVAGKNGQ